MTEHRFLVVATVAFASLVTNVAQGQPRVPKLELNLDPQTLWVEQPCPTTIPVTLQIRNNTASGGDDIDVDWGSMYIVHIPECVSDYAPKSGTETEIPAQGVRNVTIDLYFIGDCEGEAVIRFSGVIDGDPVDTDEKELTVNCNESPPVPTLPEWGLMVLTLLLLTAGTVVYGRRRAAAA